MELITRDEAIARGLKRFFTGKPCKHGHITERFVKGWLCYGCSDARAKQWVSENKDRKDQVDAAYREANREALRDKGRQRYGTASEKAKAAIRTKVYAVENAAKIAEYQRAYAVANRSTLNATKRKWRIENPANCNKHSAKRRAALRNRLPAWADQTKIEKVYALAAQMTKLTGIPHEVDHFYPLRGRRVSGLHVHENLQILTKTENVRKHNKEPHE